MINATLNKRGSIYWYDFRISGTRYRGSTGTSNYDEAQTVARQAWEKENAGTSARTADEIFSEYHAKLDKTRAPGTVNNYRLYAQRFVTFFGYTSLAALSRHSIEDWRDWLVEQKAGVNIYNPVTMERRTVAGKTNLSGKSVCEHLNWLASVLKEHGYDNVCERVERPSKTDIEQQEELKFYSPDEVKDWLAKTLDKGTADPSNANYPLLHNWLNVLFHTGCRLGEIQGIRGKDLECREKSVWVRADKTSTRRKIYLGAFKGVWESLMELQRLAKAAKPTLTNEDTIYFQKSTWLYGAMRRFAKFNGLPFKGIHATRHTFASMALASGWELSKTSKYLGHTSLQTTLGIYSHLMPQTIEGFSY